MTTDNRNAYKTESILAANERISNDTWSTGLNCNQLVLGPTGSGKTRNFLKPNLLEAQASYLVLDTKGLLFREVGPILKDLGYEVQNIDFTDVCGTVGYDPIDYIRRDPKTGAPNQRDILSVATTLCPQENFKDSFWDNAAANYMMSFIAYVLEMLPSELHTMESVIELFEQCTGEVEFKRVFSSLKRTHPESYAYRLYQRSKAMLGADRTHACIMGILSEKLMCLGFKEAIDLYRAPQKIDFSRMGHEKIALFVTVSDVDFSLMPLTNLFVTQALQCLIHEADKTKNGMLPVPVRIFLDDFSNLNIPHFDDIISVTRSREIWCTILCQSVSQLQKRYNTFGAETIMANCDVQLVLAFQDNTTTTTFAPLAGKTVDSLRATPFENSWLFVRGQKAREVKKYDVTQHPNYR